MKPIQLTKSFRKSYSLRIKTSSAIEAKFKDRLEIFKQNPLDERLRAHKLKGALSHLRSFSITGDVRLIYEEYVDRYVFLDVGTHAQVYK